LRKPPTRRPEKAKLNFSLSNIVMKNMPKLEDIKATLAEHKNELKREYGVKNIGVFGSYVRGEQKKKSDLDVLVEFEDTADLSLLDFIGLENYLGSLLGVKVDLVEKQALKPRIGRHVLEEVVNI
jgi:uncharacterized protein